MSFFKTITVTTDVDVDIEDLDTEDLVEELDRRGFCAGYMGDEELRHALARLRVHFNLGQDARAMELAIHLAEVGTGMLVTVRRTNHRELLRKYMANVAQAEGQHLAFDFKTIALCDMGEDNFTDAEVAALEAISKEIYP